jgi:hypothetical protein
VAEELVRFADLVLGRFLQLFLGGVELDGEVVVGGGGDPERAEGDGDLGVVQAPCFVDLEHSVAHAPALRVDEDLLDLAEVLALQVLHVFAVELAGVDEFALAGRGGFGPHGHGAHAEEGGRAGGDELSVFHRFRFLLVWPPAGWAGGEVVSRSGEPEAAVLSPM